MSEFLYFPPRVAVVILNFNGDDFLRQFLPSVYASTYPAIDLYVADNGSSDNSIALLKEEGFISKKEGEHDGRYLIEFTENYGFAEGYNQALKQITDAEYYVLLNSDVEVSANWMEPIIELMAKDNQIAACQPKILMHSEKELFEHAGAAGGWMDKWGYPFCRGRIFNELEVDQGQYDDVQEVFWATGAAMFIRASLYHKIGGLDGDYFAHMEEIDLCWRLKRANYKVMYCPESVVWHVGGGTLPKQSPRKTYLNFKNSLSTVFKNEEGARAWIIVFIRLILDAVAGLRFLLLGEFANLVAIVKAHWSFFASFGLNSRKKKAFQKILPEVAYRGEAQFNAAGVYGKSIVWQHFVKKTKKFSELKD